MMRLLLFISSISFLNGEGEFTCQGDKYKQASETCPDFASQRLSSGGNVNVLVKSIKNLPDRDIMGASSLSDPYVEFTVGKNIKRKTNYVKDDLSPKWNEIVNLGVLGSATEILIKIWDYDVGLEYGDDLLVSGSMRVPFCSTFNASHVQATCKHPYNCKVHDSMWSMPYRQVCHEVGEVNLKPSIPCDQKGALCLQLEFFITPFNLTMDVMIDDKLQAVPKVSALGALVPKAPWTTQNKFGALYQDAVTLFDSRPIDEFNHIKGALYFQMTELDRVAGAYNDVLFYASVNFPAYLYVCRDSRDNAKGVPGWLKNTYSAKNLSTTKLKVLDEDVIFECFMKSVPGTRKNRWGGIVSGEMSFRSNTLKGYDGGLSDADFYDNNYIVAVLPRVEAPREEDLSIYYDSGGFITKIFEHGIILAVFVWYAYSFMQKVNYRVDRVMTFLVSQVYTGVNKCIVATLFIACENQSPSNIEFRSHLCHAKNVIYFLLSIPFFLLISFGFSCVATVVPTALGYAVVFLGCGGLFVWYGLSLWESRKWHMSPYALLSLMLSGLLFFCFIISVIFADPAVFKYGHAVNLSALSVVFGCMNLFPHFLLVFHRDKAYKINLNVVIEKMTETVFKIKSEKSELGVAGKKSKKTLPVNKVLHALLGDAYTLNPNVPLFRYGTILIDSATNSKSAAERDKTASKYIAVANVILFVYLMIGIARTDYPSLCFLHCCTLLMLDSVHTSISHGNVKWSAGFHIFLLIAGRLFVMTSTSPYWIIHYSLAYLVYSISLIKEIINAFLPALTKQQAGEAAFAGKGAEESANPDVAGSPLFCFGSLSFAFVSLLMIVAYGKPDALPVTQMDVIGAYWSTYVIGLAAFLAVIVGGLLTATIRAFYLQKHGLLRGFARDGYIFRPEFRIPMLLAVFTEVAIISAGILMYGATETSALLTISIFVPPIVLCFGHAYKTWVEHDYELIVWPPVEVKSEHVDDAPSDLEVAFHMMDNMFGDEGDMQVEEFPETDVEKGPPVEKTLKGFALPSMEASGGIDASTIKMPALPLKSALRKKRQNMGVATAGTPLVDDLRAREGANADTFGNKDVLDANDPWAEYENEDKEDEDDEALQLAQEMNKKKKKKKDDGIRTGLFDSETYLKVKAAWLGNPVGALVAKQYTACIKYIKARTTKYEKVGSTDEGDKKGPDDVEPFDDNTEKDPLEAEIEAEATPIIPIKVADMDFWSAAAGGYLTNGEYFVLACWFGGLLLLMIFGIVIAKTIDPTWVGHVLWVASWMIIFTGVPIIKYFHTYVIDDTMRQMAIFTAVFHFIFCLSFFIAALDADDDITSSLWILDHFLYYPMFVYLLIEAYKWKDDNWVIEALDKDGDGDITWTEYLVYFQAYPIIFMALILLVFQMYVWVGTVMGNIALLMLLVSMIGYVFARDWSTNDFFLSTRLTMIGDKILKFILFITFMTSIFYPENPAFPVSVFFFTLVFRCCTKIGTRLIVMEPDTILFLSPFVMPVYSYDSRNNDVVDETDLAKQIAGCLFAGAMWGTAMAVFLYPVSVGVSVACVFLMIIAAIVAYAVSYVPLQLGNLVAMMSPDTMMNAVNAALETFEDRRTPLQTEMVGWDNVGSLNDDDDDSVKKKSEKKPRTAIQVATELINDTRAMQYVRDDARAKIVNIDDEDEVVVPWYQKWWLKAKDQYLLLRDALFPPDLNRGYKKHSEALLTSTDLLAEAILTGRGPLGFLGMEGLWFKLFKKAQKTPYLKFLSQPWLNVYDEYGNLTTTARLAESFDTSAVLRRQVELDKQIDGILHEEMRCGIHFLLMVIVAADAKLHREKILFQKFLRENRFRLASNGISPPAEVFTSSSYASIDIPLVAVWLSTLSQEERDRFHMLKNTFSQEQAIRDEAIDNEDYVKSLNAGKLLKDRSYRDQEMFHRITHEIQLRQAERVRAFVDHLPPQDKQVFLFNKDDWLNNADCFVNPKDVELYEKFKAAVMHDNDESTEYARQVLADVEAARRDCRIGEYGRSYQFVDPEFSPGDNSIGDCAALRQVSVWRCAPGICDSVQLFDAGTDPDDVEVGAFKSDWLLSAISMLAAAGGIGDGGVDEQVLNLFVGHYGIDGQISYHSEVGAYCVRLHKGGIWIPLVLDDLFPTLKEDFWTNENKGIACAHSKEVKELWVSLIEKAFAKYYGSYAAIEKGYVHHALSDMTGCEGECLALNGYARGPKKRVLWDMMMRYRKNGYILGAGTGSSALADKGIIEMGIVFDAAYTIYDVRQVDGHQLIKLRNPPGDHEEWKGDWSDGSTLWSRRLKKKLGWTNADDNTFWMAFDDFCNVFRDLYICKWYDKNKWQETSVAGVWQKVAEKTSLKKMSSKALTAMMLEDDAFADGQNKSEMNRPDTAGGLPSTHNPGCVLENNPFFELKIDRPTDFRMTLTQADSRGVAHGDPLPVAIYVCKSPHPKVALRLKTLNRDDVVAYSGPARADRTIHLYASLKPGIYVVLVGTYITGMENNFTLTLLSNYKTDFKQIWPPNWLDGDVNPNALLDGPDSKAFESAALNRAVANITTAFKTLIGTGEKPMTRDDASDDEEEEEDLEAIQQAAKEYKKEHGMEDEDDNV